MCAIKDGKLLLKNFRLKYHQITTVSLEKVNNLIYKLSVNAISAQASIVLNNI